MFHNLSMDENMKVTDHLIILNGIVSDLKTIGVKIDDKDKFFMFIRSPPYSHEHIKHVLIYG